MSGHSREEVNNVKVTIVETSFVKTDAANFMSVVQKLIGKEPSEGNKQKVIPIRPQAHRAVPSVLESNEAVYIANGGFELDAPCAKDVVDDIVTWMVELEPHLDELYALMK